jgi:hypothetical protein
VKRKRESCPLLLVQPLVELLDEVGDQAVNILFAGRAIACTLGPLVLAERGVELKQILLLMRIQVRRWEVVDGNEHDVVVRLVWVGFIACLPLDSSFGAAGNRSVVRVVIL